MIKLQVQSLPEQSQGGLRVGLVIDQGRTILQHLPLN